MLFLFGGGCCYVAKMRQTDHRGQELVECLCYTG
jgi:hypothetical protein